MPSTNAGGGSLVNMHVSYIASHLDLGGQSDHCWLTLAHGQELAANASWACRCSLCLLW